MDGFERSPWGPWSEYGKNFVGAEEAVAVAIEQILTDGGFLLWQKYLERKAFAFAANSISDALVSKLKMCYVPYDEGEASMDDGWLVEDEPEPSEIDSWARMYLPVRRPIKDSDATADRLSAAAKSRVMDAKRKAVAQKLPGKPQTVPGTAKSVQGTAKSESRSVPIADQIEVDEQEERLRDAKALEEARRKDKEVKLRQSERSKDEERKKVQQLHEEMSKRAHTFDGDGNLIWVEEIKVERLPKVQEAFGFNVKRDPRPRMTDELQKSTKEVSSPVALPSKNKRSTETDKKQGIEFTDFFSKLQHGQPPILETMAVQPGVTLESMGKKKMGHESNADGHMSRKEYVQLAEKEEAMGSQFRPHHSMATTESKSSPKPEARRRSVQQNDVASKEASHQHSQAAAAEGGSLGTTLPPIQTGGPAGQQNSQAGPAGNAQQPRPDVKTGVLAQAQKEPAAPPPSTRNRKFDAIGFMRPPRYHPPKLGGQYGFSAAQPPLGATMGHGLVRTGSHKEAYFFPAPTPDLPLGMLRRSASEASPGSGRRSNMKGELSIASDVEDWDSGGLMKPEMSPAYRNFRHALLPAENSGASYLRN